MPRDRATCDQRAFYSYLRKSCTCILFVVMKRACLFQQSLLWGIREGRLQSRHGDDSIW